MLNRRDLRQNGMRLSRRQLLGLAVSAAAGAIASRVACGQSYPARPVRIVSGFPPGGVNDTYARLIGHWLSDRLGQQFVENRPGAGGNIAAASVAKAIPDGYTLLLTTSADAWNASLYDNLKYNFIRDFAPIGTISRGPGVLVVHPSLPTTSVPGLIDYARNNPGNVAVASAGVGSAPHMYWELFRSVTRVDMLHVPYRGGGPAVIDLLGGQVQAYFGTTPHRSNTLERAGCERSPLPPQHVRRRCLIFRRWRSTCRATTRASTSDLLPRGARRSRSSIR